jgi:hypothetical protein
MRTLKYLLRVIILILIIVAVACSTSGDEFDSLSSDGRCEAITLKGTRCKRRAQTNSHYCWQHQSLEADYNH